MCLFIRDIECVLCVKRCWEVWLTGVGLAAGKWPQDSCAEGNGPCNQQDCVLG